MSAIALVVEDDAAILRTVQSLLADQGWRVEGAASLRAGKAAFDARGCDLLIVDLGLPDGDGVDLVAHARASGTMPIIVLSARLEEQQKIRALDAGADDYVEKPFGAGELLARVRAQSRRGGRVAVGEPMTFGDLEFDAGARTVRKAGVDVHLTAIEYRLFAFLVANAGRVLTHRQLLREVWGADRIEHTHYLRVFMASLRRKLEDDPSQPKRIVTETGIGYRLLGGG